MLSHLERLNLIDAYTKNGEIDWDGIEYELNAIWAFDHSKEMTQYIKRWWENEKRFPLQSGRTASFSGSVF